MLIGMDAIIDYIQKKNIDSMDRDIYEFGVCTGGGTGQILRGFTKNLIQYDRYFGFDSFEGLPEETKGLFRPDIWHKGAFNAQSLLGKKEDEVVPYLINLVKDLTDRPIEFVKGFYENTLTPELAKEKQFKPALFVSIDVDIYKSAFQVLEYMVNQKLLVKGTVIRYDDWGDFTHPQWEGAKEYTIGESLAHMQICKEYDIEFEQVFFESGVKVVVVK